MYEPSSALQYCSFSHFGTIDKMRWEECDVQTNFKILQFQLCDHILHSVQLVTLLSP